MKPVYLISKNKHFLESVQKSLIHLPYSNYRFICMPQEEWDHKKSGILNPLDGDDGIVIFDGKKEQYSGHGLPLAVFYFTEERCSDKDCIYKYQPVEGYINQINRCGVKERAFKPLKKSLIWMPMIQSDFEEAEFIASQIHRAYQRGHAMGVVELLPFSLSQFREGEWNDVERRSISEWLSFEREKFDWENERMNEAVRWYSGTVHPVDLALIQTSHMAELEKSTHGDCQVWVIVSNQFDMTWLKWLSENCNTLVMGKSSKREKQSRREKFCEWVKLQNPMSICVEGLEEVI